MFNTTLGGGNIDTITDFNVANDTIQLDDAIFTALGLGVLAWSPLGRGVLTGKYRTGTPADSRAASPHFERFVGVHLDPASRRIVDAVCRAADGLGLSPIEVALAWVRDRPGVTAPIVGARTAAQLRGSLTVEEVELPVEITAALDDVSALPMGYPERWEPTF